MVWSEAGGALGDSTLRPPGPDGERFLPRRRRGDGRGDRRRAGDLSAEPDRAGPTLLGGVGWEAGIVVGAFMTLAGWLAGLATLGPLLWREKGTTWHARSSFAALSIGLLGLGAWTGFLLAGSPAWAYASI